MQQYLPIQKNERKSLTSTPSEARDMQWYCILGLLPISPNTTTVPVVMEKWNASERLETKQHIALDYYRKITIGAGKTKLSIGTDLTTQNLPTRVALIHSVQQLLHLRHWLVHEEAALLTNDCLWSVLDERSGVTPRARERTDIIHQTSIVVRGVLHLLLIVVYWPLKERRKEYPF